MSQISPDVSRTRLLVAAFKGSAASLILIEQQLRVNGSRAAEVVGEALLILEGEINDLEHGKLPDSPSSLDENQLRQLKKKVREAKHAGRQMYNGRSINYWRAFVLREENRLYGPPEKRRGRPVKSL